MRKYGLIGFPVTHSFSPGYFSDKFEKEGVLDATYQAFPIEQIEKIESLFKTGIQGLNVTIPHKETIIPFLDALSKESAAVGAVNTIKIEGSKRIGYNTDIHGFEVSLLNWIDGELPGRALILGTGGAAKAVQYVLEKLGIEFSFVSRKEGYLGYENLTKEVMDAHPLIVNTTPLGMYPNMHIAPSIPFQYLTKDHYLYDLIYNPEKTLFLKKGELKSSRIKNGLEMLVLQAEKSWEIWNKI